MAETAENGPGSTVVAVEPTFTPTVPPRPTPRPVTPTLVTTPVTGSGTVEPLAHTPAPEEGVDQQPATEAQATNTPVPPPTQRYRPAERPAELGYTGFTFTSGPSVHNDVLSLSATINGQGYQPSQVQVFHSLRVEDMSGRCSTEKPLAFIAEGPGGGSTSYQWDYCISQSQRPLTYVDDVPWLSPSTWRITERERRRLTDPWTYDWTFSVSLNDERVYDLMYDSPEGFIVVIFSGTRILAKVWIQQQ